MRAAQGEVLNLGVKPELIDRAAELAGKNHTDFVLEGCAPGGGGHDSESRIELIRRVAPPEPMWSANERW